MCGVGMLLTVDGAGINFHDTKAGNDFFLVSYGKGDFMLGENLFTSSVLYYFDMGIPVINGPIAVSLTMQSDYSFTFDITPTYTTPWAWPWMPWRCQAKPRNPTGALARSILPMAMRTSILPAA